MARSRFTGPTPEERAEDEARARAIAAKALADLPEGWQDACHENLGWHTAIRHGEPGKGVYVTFHEGGRKPWTCFVERGNPCAGIPEACCGGATPREAVQASLDALRKYRAIEARVAASLEGV